MQLIKCKWCGKPFQSMGVSFCPVCIQELDVQYKPVRDYLYDNPNASIEEVMEATGASEKTILYYLRDGRLQMVNSSGLLRCEHCGAAINSGRLCEKCSNKVEERLVKPMQARMAQKKAEAESDPTSHAFNSKMYTYQERIRDRSK